MAPDAEKGQGPPGGRGAGPRVGAAWARRRGMILGLVALVAAAGFAIRAVSKRYAGRVSVPGIYVKVRPEGGGEVEARAAPAGGRGRRSGAGGAKISMEVTLADVASLARLIEEVSRVRIVLPCPVPQRVSLRARDAPVETVLEAVAAAANLTLASRNGTYLLSSCVPNGR